DVARAGRQTPVQSAPALEKCGHRGQEALAAVQVAGARVALDEEDPKLVGLGEGERAGGATHAGTSDDHVKVRGPACGAHHASAREPRGRGSNGCEAGRTKGPKMPRSPERWIGTASIAHSGPPPARAQHATAAAATM